MVLNLPYLTSDMLLAPDCRLSDGVLWLLLIRHNVSRFSLLQMLLSLESGGHLNIPGVDLFPVTSVKISVTSFSLP